MKRLNILIVDDQPINRRLLTAQLESEGHAVLAAEHGVEALAVLETAMVDVIISDILMPVMDGYRLCGQVRGSERHRDLPFIFYTATYTSPADEELCLQLGANGYLRQPVGIQQLVTAIEKALGSIHRPYVAVETEEILKEYNERLVLKLEQKNVALAEALDQVTLQATALDAAADAIIITDAEGAISWVNRAFTTITGRTLEDSAGQTAGALGLGVRDAVFTTAYWRTYREPAWHGESVTPDPDGGLHYDEVRVTPVAAQDGTIHHFVGVIHDVTKRKRAEEELRTTHAQLREFLDHSPAVLYALKIGDRVIPRLVSENVTHLLGVPQEETLGADWWLNSVHPDDRARAEAGLATALIDGASRTEYRLGHRDGTYRWVDDSVRMIRDASGQPAELVGVTTDITERRQVQDELRESERRFQSMLSNLELIAITLDRDAQITYCNDHLLRLTGWTRTELLGCNWLEKFVPGELQENVRESFTALLTDAPQAWHFENEIVTRAGKRLRIQWNNSVLRSLSGDVIGVASIGEDVTERRSLERQMLRAQRLESLGTLAGGIAHDLNNLLMPILMGATLLKRFETSERSQKAIENIERSVKRGSDLVKQVLLFARGADTLRNSVQLADVVREVESISTSTFPRNITFEISMPVDLRDVTGDTTQLTQVLLNLCVNARDAMPRGGQISISAANTDLSSRAAQLSGGASGGPYVILEVTDTGEGMPREIIDRIFDPFFTTKEMGKGTGLGLSTVQGIVSNHGGFVSVASTVEEGTTFKVYLPASEPSVVIAARDDEAPTEPPRGNGEVVMVVDDDSTVLSMTTQTLTAFGYTVVGAEDGAQAIGVYSRRSDIALVVTDMSMPIIDGQALIAALTRMDPKLPIIVATGNTAASYLAKVAKSGVAAVLTKPYTADRLLRVAADVLAARSDRRAL